MTTEGHIAALERRHKELERQIDDGLQVFRQRADALLAGGGLERNELQRLSPPASRRPEPSQPRRP